MPDVSSSKQTDRRYFDKAFAWLENQNYSVAVAKGKLAKSWDFVCVDYSGWKYVKNFFKQIPKETYERLLSYDYCPCQSWAVVHIQFIVWDEYSHKPIASPKLMFNHPDQKIPDSIKNLVK